MKKSGFAFLEMAVPIAIAIVVISAFLVYLLTHSNNAKFKPMYVKSMATLNQMASMAKIQPGYDFSEIEEPCGEEKNTTEEMEETHHTLCNIIESTLKDATLLGNLSDITYKRNDRITKYTIETDVLDDTYKDFLVYSFKDGTYLAINKDAKNCELPIAHSLYDEATNSIYKNGDIDLQKCVGFIDLNGTQPPNKEAFCTKGKNIVGENSECSVDMRQNKITDVYPIVFYNAQVVPLTAAAKKALFASKAK